MHKYITVDTVSCIHPVDGRNSFLVITAWKKGFIPGRSGLGGLDMGGTVCAFIVHEFFVGGWTMVIATKTKTNSYERVA